MKHFTPTWLMVKQHTITGLKYFCKTTKKNPIIYKGSGTRWSNHLKVHGRKVDTVWYQLFEDRDTLVEFALKFSKDNDIVASDKWANLVPEDGITGWPPGQKHRPESIQKCKENAKGFKKGHRPHNLGQRNSDSHYFNQLLGMKRFKMNKPEEYKKMLENLKSTPKKEEKRIAASKKRMTGSNNWNYDPTIYTFEYTPTGEIFKLTRNDLIKKYNCTSQNVYHLIKGTRKTVKGWKLVAK